MKIQNRIKKVIAVLLSGVLVLGLDAGGFPGSTVQVQAMEITGPDAEASDILEQGSEDTADIYAGGEDIAVQAADGGDIAVQDFGGWHNSSHSLCNDENCNDENHNLTEGASWTGVSELTDDMAAGYYYLTADVTLTAGWTPADGVVLCLNGKSITVDEDGESVIYVEIDRNVTIVSCADGGVITHSKQEDGTTPKRGSGVYIKGGTFNMYGGTINGNYVDNNGAGVNIGNGTFNMYGGTISGNEAFDNGGGVYLDKYTCVFNMNGGTISGNTAFDNGGGVYMSDGKFKMYNGAAISNNTAKNGGGVYMSDGTFNMYGGTISDNTATDGGGVYVTYSDDIFFAMRDGKISGNEATNGGGVNGIITMIGGKISGNKAENGGGVYTKSAAAIYGTSQISGNTATNGGGVYTGGSVSISGTSQISNNTATNGGGVYTDGTVSIFDTPKISGNTATDTGGGVYVNADSNVLKIVNGAQISDNRVDGKLNNVYLPQGKTIQITEHLTGNNCIGVTLETMPADGKKVVVAEPKTNTVTKFTLNDTDANAFFSDAGSKYYVALDSENNNIFMAETPHEHYLCGKADACNEVGGHKCEDKTTFTKWTSATDLPTSGTYYLTQDVTVSAQVELTGDLILDLNGHSIISEYNDGISGAIKVNDSTHTLTLTDCNGSNSTHTFKKNADNGNRWEPDTDGTGTITVTGGVITHSQGMRGSGIWVEKGNLVMYGGTICGNQTSGGGAGVHVGYSTFTMYGGAIRGNYESSSIDSTGGGVLACTSESSFTMYSGEISENTAALGGGVANCTGTFTMNGGKICNNTATEGGGIYSASVSEKTIINDGEISGNTAGCGGGVYGKYGFTMKGGEISSNESTDIVSGDGGGVFVYSGTFTMEGGKIYKNTTKAYGSRGGGGGVFVNYKAKFIMNAGEINKNEASNGSGGGVFVSGNTADEKGVFEMTGGTISRNTGKGSNSEGGDGVAVDYYAEFNMSGGTIKQNGASGSNSFGGGVYDNGTFTMSGGAVISGNTGRYGGVYATNDGKFIMSGGTITENNGTDAGGVYMFPSDNISSRITVSGTAKIYDNWKDKTASNLYVPDSSALHNLITVGRAMTIGDDGAKIGVSTENLPTKDSPIKIADDDTTYTITDDDAKAFFADAGDKYCVMKGEDDALYLAVKPHEHSWSYTAKDDTITATCSADDCDVVTTSLKIVPPDSSKLTYDDTEKEAKFEYTYFTTLTGLDVPVIEYKKGTGPNNTLPYGSMPIDAGSYTATASFKIAEGSYLTIGVDFEIKKADLKAADFTFKAPDDLIYSGMAKSAAVTSGKADSGITVKYYDENGREVGEAKNAGTYTVKIDVAESKNYNAAGGLTEDGWKFTINPAAITVTPEAGQEKIYGDSDPVLKYSFSGAVSGEIPAFEGALSKGSVENAGEYDIVIGSLKLADSETFTAGNYKLELNSTPVKFTIKQKNVSITGLKAENKIYDGTTDAAVTGTPVLEGLLSGDEGLVTVDDSGVTAKFVDKDAGTGKNVVSDGYKLSGTKAGNYSLTNPAVELTADIMRKELTINKGSAVVISRKTYDGKVSADVSNVILDGIVAGDNLVFLWNYTAKAAFDTAAVGVDKNITLSVELYDDKEARNYTFAEGADTCILTGGEIEKATVAAPADVELVVISGATKTYKITLPGLPALEAPREYGKCDYTVDLPDLKYGYEGTAAISSDGTELTLNIIGAGSYLGDVGTVKVTAKTENYEDIILTVNVRATDKIIPQLEGEVTLSPAEIAYGTPLSGITITGKMTDGNNTSVTGKFEWQSPADVLSVGTHNNVAWTFTPDDNQTYEVATGGATVIVNKAAQSGTVSMANYTYNDTPSKPSLIDRVGDADAVVTYYYTKDNANSGGTEWKDIRPDTLNAGSYYMYAVIAETANYSGYTTPAVKFEVLKAAPGYTRPEGRTAKYGQKLSEITLPNTTAEISGTWSWMEPDTVLDKIGTTKYDAMFTPDNSNYKRVVGVAVEVTVSPAAGKNLATVELTQKYADSSDQTYIPDWMGLPAGQTWSYDIEYSINDGSTAKLTKKDISATNGELTYAISGGKAGDKITITLKALCDNYEPYTITLNVTIAKAVPTGEPKYTKITAEGMILADAGLTLAGSTITPAAGTLEWIDDNGNVLPLTTKVEADRTYKWRFTPADDNYTTLIGEVELYRELPPEYMIISGADSTWLQDTDGSLVISGNGEYSKFRDVKVDGVVIDPKNYTVTEGSTIVTLKAEYLETLSEGSHTFEIVWSNGSAATSFVVKLEDSGDDDTPDTTPGSAGNNPVTDVPPTGDDFNPVLWITLLMAALAGLAVLLVSGRKDKKNKNRYKK